MTEVILPRLVKAVVIAITLFTQSAFALIGENEKQIEARYGHPKKIGEFGKGGQDRTISYVAKGFAIDVGFIAGISRRETFSTVDKSPITEDAIKMVLAISSKKGQTWQSSPLPQPKSPPNWQRSDGKVAAIATPTIVNVYPTFGN